MVVVEATLRRMNMIEQILHGNDLNFNNLEKKIYKFVCMLGCMLLKLILEKKDKDIAQRRDKKIYRHKGYKTDCIKTVMGEVVYRRAVYEVKEGDTKRYVFLLNEEVKICSVGKFSANLTEKIIDVVCHNSYRATAQSIENISQQSISHEAVRNVVYAVGKRLSDREQECAKLLKAEKLEAGKKEIPALFEEADGLWISLQGKDKEKAIQRYKEKIQKQGKEYKAPKRVKSELKLYVSYEGWKQDARHSLVEKQYIAGFMSTKQLYWLRKAKLHQRYCVEKIRMKVLNGDGAAWIKKLRLKHQFYQKDNFHIRQAIVRHVKTPESREKIGDFIKKKRYYEIHEYLESLKFECGGEEKQVKQLTTLQRYLKDGLPRYKDEVKEIPKAPEGIEYRDMGICESQIFSVLSRRLSDRRMSFSKEGATLLSKILAKKAENKDEALLDTMETEIQEDNQVEEWIADIEKQVEASKLARRVKLKKESPIKLLKKPFEGAALQEYMKVIRNLTRFLPVTDLNYK